MASSNRRPAADIIQSLLAKPKAYSFFQAVRLLRQQCPEPSDKEFFKNNLRIRPLLSLNFPATDVFDIEPLAEPVEPEEENEPQETKPEEPEEPEAHDGPDTPLTQTETPAPPQHLMTTNFFGLYGTYSPLPTHYTEELMAEAADDQNVSRAFVDILHQAFYRLLYLSWSKYRWALNVTEAEKSTYFERLSCLLGLGSDAARRTVPESRSLLRYIGLFTQFPRSAAGLQTMLADALGESSLRITPCIARLVDIPSEQRCRLGHAGASLGEDCFLGQKLQDRSGKIRISIGPINDQTFHELLPGNALNQKINDLVGAYFIQPIEYELRVALRPGVVRTVSLGTPEWGCLGMDSWVFSGPRLHRGTEVTLQNQPQ